MSLWDRPDVQNGLAGLVLGLITGALPALWRKIRRK